MKKITIYDRKFGKDHQVLEIKITDEGNLVFEGYDIGEFVKEYWGDSDYEYWLTIKAEHIPTVLLHLIKKCFDEKIFTNDSEFKTWLNEKGIPSEFHSWV
ncbi:MAG: hypothetical protein HWN66_08655 [Candidatus Helarchaeota archaeon]|nr:hypothetical protein [Candidatus Helarchaeota archaeon]